LTIFSKRHAVLMTAIWVLAVIGILSLVGCASDEPAPTPEPQAIVIDTPIEIPAGEPLRRHTVEIYFPSDLGDGLIGEYREIFLTATPEDRAKQIIADLISGPTGPDSLRAVPVGTWLKQAYVLKTGVTYLDFSEDLREGIGGGSMEELLTVYAIVNSVARNVPEVGEIYLLVNGELLATLNGHMDLRLPLLPDYSLILVPKIVRSTWQLPATS
jgi:hypothetical protein